MTNKMAFSMGVVLVMVSGCMTTPADKIARFSAQWKVAPPEQRGMLLPENLPDYLIGKDRTQVIAVLGEPDNTEPVLTSRDGQNHIPARMEDGVLLPDNFLYDCGHMNGSYQWTLIICFNEDGKAYQIGLDDLGATSKDEKNRTNRFDA